MIPQEYNRNHRKWFAKKCLRAISRYSMIADGEPVCVALSGGKDSAVLLYILWYLNRYGPFSFPLYAAHIKTAAYDTSCLKKVCDELEITYLEDQIHREPDTEASKVCYICSRLKRGALRGLLENSGIFTLAYGHHADDVAETFFMNIIHGAKLGSFSPVVGIPESRVKMIRPMIYLREQTIRAIHSYLRLPLLDYRCPHESASMRVQMKERMAGLDELFATSDFVDKLVAALENVDMTNHWPALAAVGDKKL